MALRKIKLYGALGKKFGKVHEAHVESVGEAIRFLSANYKEFAKYIVNNKRVAGYEVWDGQYNLGEEKEGFVKLGDGEIKIIPRARGSSAAGRILAGIVIIAAAYFTWGASLAGGAGMAYGMGASLVLGGVIELLSPKPNLSTNSTADTSESYIFNGATNSTRMGNPVFIGYGEMKVGSQVISKTVTTHDIPV